MPRRRVRQLGGPRTGAPSKLGIHRRPERSQAPADAAHAASLRPAVRAGGVHHRQSRRASRWTSRTPRSALPSRRIDVRSGGVDSVLAAEAAGRTRLVLNLDRLLPYSDPRVGQRHHRAAWRGAQQLGLASGSPLPAGSSSSPVARPRLRPLPPVRARIRGIDFRRGTAGTGRVIVRLSDPHTPASLRQLGNQIVVDFAGAEVASNLARRYDAGDFATPVDRLRCRARR